MDYDTPGNIVELKRQSAKLDVMIAGEEVRHKTAVLAGKVVDTKTAEVKLEGKKIKYNTALAKNSKSQVLLNYHEKSLRLSEVYYNLKIESQTLDVASLNGEVQVKEANLLGLGLSLEIPALQGVDTPSLTSS
ncbi:MAG: hypothetical protein F6K44_00975 [Moorea sp. SIO3E2]|nr:hypothetical protein [Moorena sp. SIO3E2]